MKHFIATLAILLFALQCWAEDPIRTFEGTVTRVSDGDTIQVTDQHGTKVKVRLYGIDAPETKKGSTPGQPYGEESFQALRHKVDRQQVRLDVMDIDKYKRLVAIVWLPDRNINREMISDGAAWAYRKYLGRPHASEYINVEEQAQKSGKGLWKQNNPQPPWEFRKAPKSMVVGKGSIHETSPNNTLRP